MGAWCSNKGQISNLKELIKIARKGLEIDYFICLKPSTDLPEIPENTREILDNIENFNYKIVEEILSFDFAGIYKGHIISRVGSTDFKKLCQEINSQNPNTAKDLLKLMGGFL